MPKFKLRRFGLLPASDSYTIQALPAFVQTKNDILQVQGVPQKIIFGIYRNKSYKLAAPRKDFYLATFF